MSFSDNIKQQRFEYAVEGSVAYANYRREGSTLYIDYVFAPPELRGKGASGKLMQEIVGFAKEENLRIVPICGYAATWLSRNGKPDQPRP